MLFFDNFLLTMVNYGSIMLLRNEGKKEKEMKRFKVIEYGKEFDFDNVEEALNKVEELTKKLIGYSIIFMDNELKKIKVVEDTIDFNNLF